MIFRVLMSCGAPSVPPPPAVEPQVEPAPAEQAPIVIDSPAPGTAVEPGRLVVKGTARVFEGRFTVKLLAGDELLGQKSVLTDEAGTWYATFDVPEGQSGGDWKLQAYSQSAKDGSVANVVEVPLEGP